MDIPSLIKFPVKFQIGKIFDSEGNHILDIRGWGRLQYLPDPEAKQDGIGEFVAKAINEKLQRMTWEPEKLRQNAKDILEYTIVQCGGNTKSLNIEGVLNKLGF